MGPQRPSPDLWALVRLHFTSLLQTVVRLRAVFFLGAKGHGSSSQEAQNRNQNQAMPFGMQDLDEECRGLYNVMKGAKPGLKFQDVQYYLAQLQGLPAQRREEAVKRLIFVIEDNQRSTGRFPDKEADFLNPQGGHEAIRKQISLTLRAHLVAGPPKWEDGLRSGSPDYWHIIFLLIGLGEQLES